MEVVAGAFAILFLFTMTLSWINESYDTPKPDRLETLQALVGLAILTGIALGVWRKFGDGPPRWLAVTFAIFYVPAVVALLFQELKFTRARRAEKAERASGDESRDLSAPED